MHLVTVEIASCNSLLASGNSGLASGISVLASALLKITFGKRMTMCPGQDIHAFWLEYQCHPQIKDVHGCQQG